MNKDAVPAAQYLRMSTDHQQYSIANQTAAISEYAARNGFAVVRTYEDSGRSGLLLKNREALTALLRDVVTNPVYKAILVYDVSRWGRFQDVDESAHYEFICRSAGVPIHYCAEQFNNDGSLSSLIVKSVKRAMAAEFSRELGDKVVRGKQRLTAMGFSVGGSASYGLRRMLVATDGSHKQMLHTGESKALATDRVVLVHGPRHEVETVRMIFNLVLEKGYRPEAIARYLNERGIAFLNEGSWSRENVDRLLRNPKYTGANVWGRSTGRLHTKTRDTSKDQWTTREGSFPAIIDSRTFESVQKFLSDWRWTDDELLNALREVWRREGEVNYETLCRVGYGPHPGTVISHFGGLRQALDRIGYLPPDKRALNLEHRAASIRLHEKVIQQIAAAFPRNVKVVRKSKGAKREIILDGHRIAVLIANPQTTSVRHTSWGVYPRPDEYSRPALCCFASHGYKQITALYVTVGLPQGRTRIAIRPNDSRFVKIAGIRKLRTTIVRLTNSRA